MTILQNDAGMVDADLGEMVGPDAERLTVGYGEGKVVQVLSCRFSRLSIELFGEPLVRPSVDSRSVREHNHNLCPTVSERDVSDASRSRQRARARVLRYTSGRLPRRRSPEVGNGRAR